MRYHLTPVRMASIKKTRDKNARWDVENKEITGRLGGAVG